MKILKFWAVLALVSLLSVGCGKKSGIEGRVVDGKGQPLADVKVVVSQLSPIIKGYEQFETTTGSDGTFRFGKLYPSAKYSLITWNDTWANMPMMMLEYDPGNLRAQFYKGGWITDQKMIVQSGPDGETLLLPAPIMIKQAITTIEGKIVNGNGQPFSDLKVIVQQVEPMKGYEQFETITDSDGNFRFDKLCPNSQYILIAQKDNFFSEKKTLKTLMSEQFGKYPNSLTMRFMISSERVIADFRTDLEWVVGPDLDTNFEQAQQWVETCHLAGGGWRLPTLQEFRTIYQPGVGVRNLDPAFSIKTRYFYDEYVWSDVKDSSTAWSFRFYDGNESSRPKFHKGDGRVFGVRSRTKISKHGNDNDEEISQSVKASGYLYQENENFTPGVYESIVNAMVYFDVDENAFDKKLFIKKGIKINVYSAGYNGSEQPSTNWFNLDSACNGNILPWNDLGWIGVLSKDFKRVGDIPKLIYKNGEYTNCR